MLVVLLCPLCQKVPPWKWGGNKSGRPESSEVCRFCFQSESIGLLLRWLAAWAKLFDQGSNARHLLLKPAEARKHEIAR